MLRFVPAAAAVRRGIRSRCRPAIINASTSLSARDEACVAQDNSNHQRQNRSFATRRRQRVNRTSSRFNPSSPLAADQQPSDHEQARGSPQQPSAPSNLTDDERILSQSSDLLQNASVRPNTQTTHSVHSVSAEQQASDQPFDPGMPVDEYLRMASLSPWVPCPDVVARRMLDIGKADSTTRHYDLGCGDGRLNFHALDTYAVRHTTGIDIDPNLIQRAEERLSRRHPRPGNVDFVTADLLDAPELWKEMGSDPDTVITCYFVEEALQKIRPLLEEHCGSSGIRIVTCGYEMRGWHAQWSEVVLGLPIFLYELQDDEESPPSIEELKAVMSMADSNEVLEAAARAAEIDGGGWKSGAAEDQYREPEAFDYVYDPNERVDGHWDDFDQADEDVRRQEEEEARAAEEAKKKVDGQKKKANKEQ